MKVKKLMLGLLAILIILAAVLSGCETSTSQVMQKEYQSVSVQASKFQQTQPVPQISFSSTRDAVIKRIERWSDPNKISYIYLVSFGRVMAFYTVKGSVESKQSYLSPVTAPYGNSNGYTTIDTPDIDGTYGDNMDSIFFFTTDSVYVEWHGDYMWVDQPLKLSTQPELIYVAPLDQKP
jgi:hypothetical protein